MAYAARSLELVQGLITSITGRKNDKAQGDQINKALREHSSGRTNQFAVKSKLDGLIEKFSVLGRDDLAAALQTRLDKLRTEDNFLPDKLAFLLELSDMPHRKVDPNVLAHLTEQNTSPPEQLSWADIVRDDPLDEDIWDDIERGYHSSGDEGDGTAVEFVSRASSSTGQTSVDGNLHDIARAQLVHLDLGALSVANPPTVTFTELRLVRETLFMLRGLPAEFYVVDRVDGSVCPSTTAALLLTTMATTQDLLRRVASLGSSLNLLRAWSRSTRDAPHVRTCQAVVQNLLQSFNDSLTAAERSLAGKHGHVLISMMELCSDVEKQAHCLVLLAETIRHAASEITNSPAALLDHLYGITCIAHATSDLAALDVFRDLLVATTETFLRPIAQWCLSGAVDDRDKNPLVVDKAPECPRSDVWHERFALRVSYGGQKSVPSFLVNFTDELFALGKSKMFCDLLEPDKSAHAVMVSTIEVRLGGLYSNKESFVPFSQQFHDSLTSWLGSLRTANGEDLARSLLMRHRLPQQFDAIESMFLRKDGSSFSHFSETLFELLQQSHRRQRHLDDFILTELARESFGSLSDIASDDVSICLAKPKTHNDDILRVLDSLELRLTTSWHVSNITKERSPMVEQKSFRLLLQLDIAKRLLVEDLHNRRGWLLGRMDGLHARVHCLQQCLIDFIDTVTLQITTAGAELSVALRNSLKQATGLDAMIEAYEKFAGALNLITMTQVRLRPVRDALIDILCLAEHLAHIKRSMSLNTPADQYLQRIRSMFKQYQDKLQSIISRLDAEASAQDDDMLKAYADALNACLPNRTAVADSII